MNQEETLSKIRELTKAYFNGSNEDFEARKIKIPLMIPTYDHEEVMQIIDSLFKKQLTLNQYVSNKVGNFEDLWADFIGVKNGIMYNSGSSANLIALSILTNPSLDNNIEPGSEIITPALTWTTTVSPIFNINCKPVFVDVDMDTFTVDPDEIEKAISPKTKAIMPVHLLGYPCDMDRIMEIAKKHNLFVIEDCCEAHSAELNGKKVGSFGDVSTFSFFFSHHLSTIEGGMVLTDNDEYAELARIMRSQGVMRNVKSKEYENRYYENEAYKKIDPKYLFVNIGFNFRPMELQGGFGIEQFKKFNCFLKAREDNANFFLKEFEKFSDHIALPKLKENMKHAWFAFPIMVKENAPFTRKELETFLNEKTIETRQIMSGNILRHPALKLFEHGVVGDLKNTNYIHDNAFFFWQPSRYKR